MKQGKHRSSSHQKENVVNYQEKNPVVASVKIVPAGARSNHHVVPSKNTLQVFVGL